MNDSVEWYGDYTYPMLFLVFCAVIHISRYKLINYISLSLSTSSLVLFLPLFFLSFVFIWFYLTFSPSSAYSPLALSAPITPNADSNPLSRLPIPRHLRASNHSRLSRPGNFMLELTGSMEGTSQRDPHPGRRPVIFHHLHFRATPAASQPLAPISSRNCWRREKFVERQADARR